MRNNFDFLRLLFATFVIITHSYVLTGMPENDLLSQLTRGQMAFSSFGVNGFFIIGGYLVCQSLSRSKTVGNFLWKRCLRIFPALIVALFLTLFLAYFVYENNITAFYKNPDVYSYVPNNALLFFLQYEITGVFENNPKAGIINGSLWTLPYEFLLYIILSCLFFIRHNNKVLKVVLFSTVVLLYIVHTYFAAPMYDTYAVLSPRFLFPLSMYFLVGSLIATVNLRGYHLLFLIGSFAGIVLSLYFKQYYYTQFMLLPIFIICLGETAIYPLHLIKKSIGDLSYGVYIYAFPIQQLLVYLFKPGHITLMLATIPLSLLAGFLSWNLVEKNSLKLKHLNPLKTWGDWRFKKTSIHVNK